MELERQIMENMADRFSILAASGDTASLWESVRSVETEYVILQNEKYDVDFHSHAMERLLQIADSTGADMLYSDCCVGNGEKHPLIDMQAGSLRDDFDFGPAVLFRRSSLLAALCGQRKEADYRFAALYDLRLRMEKVFHVRECLYGYVETDLRKSGEKQFDYVKASNREIQKEMEAACTAHLRRVGAYLGPRPEAPDPDGVFPVTASVVIPVRNRVDTVGDAVRSALSQECGFDFNVIVVDNHSTDGTAQLLRALAESEPRLRVMEVPPERKYAGIGGCWNIAVDSPECGLYAVQLDSDDIYSDSGTLAKIVGEFRRQRCAMLVGAYTIVDFDLNILPPGLIDHREWTDGNGHNNALRVNGLGAPRAFRTDILRQIHFPDVSYGEDYAVALRLSGMYRVGRIFESLYFCRRWSGNSDAALDIAAQNANNLYKDSLRTAELLYRIRRNREGELNEK